jgi:hypothetical protein
MFKIRKLSELNKLPNNPRTIQTEDFKRLCTSIKDNPDYFKARPLILSNRTGQLVIIAGNQRYEAAKSLKLPSVPTYLLEGLNEDREREIVIRDNISNGEWDYELLANEWDTELLTEWGMELPKTDWQPEVEENTNTDNVKSKITITCSPLDLQDILDFIQVQIKSRGYIGVEIK